MLFHVYGEHALAQWGMMLAVLIGLILLNEFTRRTKWGGIVMLGIIPAGLTVYFLSILIGGLTGAEWVATNPTHLYMGGWFHYAKLYAALAGCIGFCFIKYNWGIGKQHWFKSFPFWIVAINILIAVASDFEHAIKFWHVWGLSNEGVLLYGGEHNIMNGIAGLFDIFCMTAWWNVYGSKDKKDMIWADMTWVFILVYDVWNFAYTYNSLPTHSWYCGIALLLAPTVAALCWNKGGWIMNRANTLAIWCMFAQIVPLFQEWILKVDEAGTAHLVSHTPWATLPTIYANGTVEGIVVGSSAGADPTANIVVSALALVLNVVAFGYIMIQAKKRHINPYKEDVFVNQKYYKDAVARIG